MNKMAPAFLSAGRLAGAEAMPRRAGDAGRWFAHARLLRTFCLMGICDEHLS
jgi:hypothetical protein